MLKLLCLTLSLFLCACEKAPCESPNRLEGTRPIDLTDEQRLAFPSNEVFEAMCVVDSAHGALRNGEYWLWYPGGTQLKMMYEFDGGIKHGSYQLYYLSGQIKEEGNYRYGLRHGRFKTWHEDGSLHIEGMYQDGKKHGDFVITSTSGFNVKKGMYFIGHKHGPWTNEYTALNGQVTEVRSNYHYGQPRPTMTQ